MMRRTEINWAEAPKKTGSPWLALGLGLNLRSVQRATDLSLPVLNNLVVDDTSGHDCDGLKIDYGWKK